MAASQGIGRCSEHVVRSSAEECRASNVTRGCGEDVVAAEVQPDVLTTRQTVVLAVVSGCCLRELVGVEELVYMSAELGPVLSG